ncbi:hypothetical protein [Embleya scabrispora]|uniref:hypothetical protein n=1 Tax=Embleya scabrispora TaxID=159449 RepID=UPI000376138A|nr:hypothetical protein [Embleya scabrispora]MYS85506.1 hypothetical protein [Streptomyces sp. SID5474]
MPEAFEQPDQPVAEQHAVGRLVQDAPLILPWTTLAAITAACALIALLGTVLPAQALLRHRPTEPAASRE